VPRIVKYSLKYRNHPIGSRDFSSCDVNAEKDLQFRKHSAPSDLIDEGTEMDARERSVIAHCAIIVTTLGIHETGPGENAIQCLQDCREQDFSIDRSPENYRF
jgi:hypothetical protein